jgi:hypothetical protein
MSPSRASRPVAVLSGLAVCLFAPGGAQAMVLVAADLQELVIGARTVVHGRVVSVTPQWLEGRRGVETIVTLAVEDTLKGTASEDVSFRVPGGQMGPYRSFMPGAPVFVEGEDVIVFLAGDGPVIPHLVGFSQGVYRVRAVNGVRVVRQGVPAPGGEAPVAMTRGAGRRPEPLQGFEAQVRDLARAEGVR